MVRGLHETGTPFPRADFHADDQDAAMQPPGTPLDTKPLQVGEQEIPERDKRYVAQYRRFDDMRVEDGGDFEDDEYE